MFSQGLCFSPAAPYFSLSLSLSSPRQWRSLPYDAVMVMGWHFGEGDGRDGEAMSVYTHVRGVCVSMGGLFCPDRVVMSSYNQSPPPTQAKQLLLHKMTGVR